MEKYCDRENDILLSILFLNIIILCTDNGISFLLIIKFQNQIFTLVENCSLLYKTNV